MGEYILTPTWQKELDFISRTADLLVKHQRKAHRRCSFFHLRMCETWDNSFFPGHCHVLGFLLMPLVDSFNPSTPGWLSGPPSCFAESKDKGSAAALREMMAQRHEDALAQHQIVFFPNRLRLFCCFFFGRCIWDSFVRSLLEIEWEKPSIQGMLCSACNVPTFAAGFGTQDLAICSLFFFLLAEFLKINSGPKGWDFKRFEGYTELLLLQVQFDMFTFVFGVNCRYPYNHFHNQNPLFAWIFLPQFCLLTWQTFFSFGWSSSIVKVLECQSWCEGEARCGFFSYFSVSGLCHLSPADAQKLHPVAWPQRGRNLLVPWDVRRSTGWSGKRYGGIYNNIRWRRTNWQIETALSSPHFA